MYDISLWNIAGRSLKRRLMRPTSQDCTSWSTQNGNLRLWLSCKEHSGHLFLLLFN